MENLNVKVNHTKTLTTKSYTILYRLLSCLSVRVFVLECFSLSLIQGYQKAFNKIKEDSKLGIFSKIFFL